MKKGNENTSHISSSWKLCDAPSREREREKDAFSLEVLEIFMSDS